jgi:hypothetical protein
MPFTDFAAALQTMQETGLVTVSGAPGQELVEITPQGRQVARLAG